MKRFNDPVFGVSLALLFSGVACGEGGWLDDDDGGASSVPIYDLCIGVDPASVSGQAPVDESSIECEQTRGTCLGEPSPDWQLEDVQPQSCGFGERYGLGAFRGKRTVMVLLAAW